MQELGSQAYAKTLDGIQITDHATGTPTQHRTERRLGRLQTGQACIKMTKHLGPGKREGCDLAKGVCMKWSLRGV